MDQWFFRPDYYCFLFLAALKAFYILVNTQVWQFGLVLGKKFVCYHEHIVLVFRFVCNILDSQVLKYFNPTSQTPPRTAPHPESLGSGWWYQLQKRTGSSEQVLKTSSPASPASFSAITTNVTASPVKLVRQQKLCAWKHVSAFDDITQQISRWAKRPSVRRLGQWLPVWRRMVRVADAAL